MHKQKHPSVASHAQAPIRSRTSLRVEIGFPGVARPHQDSPLNGEGTPISPYPLRLLLMERWSWLARAQDLRPARDRAESQRLDVPQSHAASDHGRRISIKRAFLGRTQLHRSKLSESPSELIVRVLA